MRVSDLKRDMDGQFAKVDERFAKIDERFAKIDERFAKIDERFAKIDERFTKVDERFDVLERRILEEGERTRGHMDILYEKFKTEVRLSLDRSIATAADVDQRMTVNAAEHAGFIRILDDHESRLKAVERQ
jgi:predicted transcriptional regulator